MVIILYSLLYALLRWVGYSEVTSFGVTTLGVLAGIIIPNIYLSINETSVAKVVLTAKFVIISFFICGVAAIISSPLVRTVIKTPAEIQSQTVLLTLLIVFLFVVGSLFLLFRHTSSAESQERKAKIYAQWGEVDLQKASQQEAVRELAKALVYSVFPKDIKIFDAAASLFFSRASIEPVPATAGSSTGGRRMGSFGRLGAIQALSFALLVIQHINSTAKDNSITADESARQFVRSSEAREKLVRFADKLEFDKITSQKLINTMIELLRLTDESEIHGVENE